MEITDAMRQELIGLGWKPPVEEELEAVSTKFENCPKCDGRCGSFCHHCGGQGIVEVER
jgi:hypothetical protein